MKFEVTTAETHYHVDSDEVGILKEFGFSFEETPPFWENDKRNYLRIKDEDVFVEINTLEELLEFTKKYGNIVFGENSIIIYNGWLE